MYVCYKTELTNIWQKMCFEKNFNAISIKVKTGELNKTGGGGGGSEPKFVISQAKIDCLN